MENYVSFCSEFVPLGYETLAPSFPSCNREHCRSLFAIHHASHMATCYVSPCNTCVRYACYFLIIVFWLFDAM